MILMFPSPSAHRLHHVLRASREKTATLAHEGTENCRINLRTCSDKGDVASALHIRKRLGSSGIFPDCSRFYYCYMILLLLPLLLRILITIPATTTTTTTPVLLLLLLVLSTTKSSPPLPPAPAAAVPRASERVDKHYVFS